MKNITLFTLVSFLLCAVVACSENNVTAEQKAFDKEREEERNEWDLVDSIVGGSATTIRFNHSRGGDGTYISDGFRIRRVIDSTIEIRKFIKDLIINIRFNDPSACNYDNTKILIDGKEITGELQLNSYGNMLFKDIFENQDETHHLEILLDSAQCGNLKESYTLVPSKNPGEAHFTEVCYYAANDYGDYVNGYFYSMVEPCYYGGFYSTYADTVQSKCFLKTESDSIELKIEFDKNYDFMNARYYQDGKVSLDSSTLVNFLNGDSSATLSCALIFQDWFVPAQVNREYKYYDKTIRFKNVEKVRLTDVIANDEYYLITVEPSNFVNILFTRTTVNGEKIFAKESYGLYDSTSLGFLHKIRWKDVYNGLIDESTSEDSVQVLVLGWASGCTTQEDDEIIKKIRSVYSEKDSAVFATTLDSLMDLVTDEAGNIKDRFYFMDAKRVPGYDISNFTQE